MEPVIIAVGSNLGDRHDVLKKTGAFLESLSAGEIHKSSIWDSEPIGPSKYNFLNCAARIKTRCGPFELLELLKGFEQKMGRKKNSKRWGPRILDLDIIAWGRLVIHEENLIIPHPEYSKRQFVLLPMNEITQGWADPITGKTLNDYLKSAPDMQIEKTKLMW